MALALKRHTRTNTVYLPKRLAVGNCQSEHTRAIVRAHARERVVGMGGIVPLRFVVCRCMYEEERGEGAGSHERRGHLNK